MTEQEQTTVTEEVTTADEAAAPSIDYTEQLTRIEEALNKISEQIETHGSVSYFESNGVGFIDGDVNTVDIFSVLLMIAIMLGLIFGALVFRHFRK